MAYLKNISFHLRFLLLAVSLLSVLSLDKREVAVYLPQQTENQAVKTSGKQCIVKEKVSFEAVTSFIVIPDAILPDIFSFTAAVFTPAAPILNNAPSAVPALFTRLLQTAISPNAP